MTITVNVTLEQTLDLLPNNIGEKITKITMDHKIAAASNSLFFVTFIDGETDERYLSMALR